MATFSQKARALQQAQDTQRAVDTRATRQAVRDAQEALRTSREATEARSFHNQRIANGRGGSIK